MGRRRRAAIPWLAGALVLAMLAFAGVVIARRLEAPLPPVHVGITVDRSAVLSPGAPPLIPVPGDGAFQLDSDLDGLLAARNEHSVRPIGSVAKIMTALTVLEAHPLQGAEAGPILTMTQSDVGFYRQALAEQGSTVPVAVGERLSERDLLLALLLPSANNAADTLSVWVAGDRSPFVAMLNDHARALGMTQTHFDDASGYSPMTVSTAADLVILARAALQNAQLAGLAATRSASLPDGTLLRNLDALLDTQPGWLGVKTGWTPQAGGCLMFAAHRSFPNAPPVTVFGAVLGQPPLAVADPGHPELGGALAAARAAVDTALYSYVVVDPARVSPALHGDITSPWGARASAAVRASASRPLPIRIGTPIALAVTLRQPASGPLAGEVLGSVSGRLRGTTVATWSLIARQTLPAPSLWWRLTHAQ